ncbi:CSC1-like protein [Pyrus ussuriensis x Pyrus communis]|uniref:CSC1-like protein n=1 Tax=Pyrus ussuriensis x Pyrus communis TaxID=2448454 RepID=A0A5N5HZ86_9ROSA|nr:CSC1-like protein [Pyrus ussuriensis x Pyrus communis]
MWLSVMVVYYKKCVQHNDATLIITTLAKLDDDEEEDTEERADGGYVVNASYVLAPSLGDDRGEGVSFMDGIREKVEG